MITKEELEIELLQSKINLLRLQQQGEELRNKVLAAQLEAQHEATGAQRDYRTALKNRGEL